MRVVFLAHTVYWNDKLVAFTSLGAAILVVISAIVAAQQLLEARRTRYATLISDLTRRWDEPLLQAARFEATQLAPDEIELLVIHAYAAPKGVEDKLFLQIQALPNFFEYLGVLVFETKGVNQATVNVLWRSSVLGNWRRWEPTIRWIRRESGSQTPYKNFQRLYEALYALPDP